MRLLIYDVNCIFRLPRIKVMALVTDIEWERAPWIYSLTRAENKKTCFKKCIKINQDYVQPDHANVILYYYLCTTCTRIKQRIHINKSLNEWGINDYLSLVKLLKFGRTLFYIWYLNRWKVDFSKKNIYLQKIY